VLGRSLPWKVRKSSGTKHPARAYAGASSTPHKVRHPSRGPDPWAETHVMRTCVECRERRWSTMTGCLLCLGTAPGMGMGATVALGLSSAAVVKSC
jgi:hypothetical protein